MKRTLLILTLVAAAAALCSLRGHRQFVAFDSPYSMGDYVFYAADADTGIAAGHGVIIQIAIDKDNAVSYVVADPITNEAHAGVAPASITY